VTNPYIEKLRQCAINHDCKEGKMGFCSRHCCRLVIKCEECGWQGKIKEAIHTYCGTGAYVTPDGNYDEDIEPVDECPECGSENLILIEEELSYV